MNRDEETLIVHRGKKAFVILNRFPYTSGHVMIVPYAHVAELNLCEPGTLEEMMELAQKMESVFRMEYKPDGMNLGMNLGKRRGRALRDTCIFTSAALVRRFEFHDRNRGNAGASRRN